MSRHHDYQRQLNLARKAGLNAREINLAQAGRPAAAEPPAQTDTNGFAWGIDERGNRTCKPDDAVN